MENKPKPAENSDFDVSLSSPFIGKASCHDMHPSPTGGDLPSAQTILFGMSFIEILELNFSAGDF
jgi:hypothetical protein